MTLEFLLRRLPIQRKLLVLTLAACGVILLLACAGVFAFQIFIFKRTFARDLTFVADVLAANASGPVTFGDRNAAQEILKGVTAEGHVVAAEILLADGNRFVAAGTQSPRLRKDRMGAGSSPQYEGSYLFVESPIRHEDEFLGTLFLRADFHRTYLDLVWLYAVVLCLVFGGSFVVALLVSTRLQRFITLPVLNLAETARVIADRHDYSVRAKRMSDDEIGLLTDAFNQMLARIQGQDSALRWSQQKFETLVNSIEGIVWEADPSSLALSFVSQQAERLLGYPLELWLNDPDFWRSQMHPDDRESVLQVFRKAIADKRPFACEYRLLSADQTVVWIRNLTTVSLDGNAPALLRGVMIDITERKKAEEELKQLHNQLVLASRQAGMAEVATGVLHNVGNVLNSVNVSTTLLFDQVRQCRSATLSKAAAILKEHLTNFAEFVTVDPRGKALPKYLIGLAENLEQQRAQQLSELTQLAKNIQHIKDIIAMQQNYAKVSGVVESLAPAEMVEDALQMNTAALREHGIELVREFEPVPMVRVDKHKVLQILINLIRNAKYALTESESKTKELRIHISQADSVIRITVADTGIGIAPENLTRIFCHGFTTKRDGHGFGLHSGAIAAKEMGGSLIAQSPGPGKGATFILELPVATDRPSGPSSKFDVPC